MLFSGFFIGCFRVGYPFPIVTEGGDFAGFGVAGVILADAGFLSGGLAGRRGGFCPLAPVVAEGGNFFGFGVAGVVLAGAGLFTGRGAGRRGRGNPVVPVVAGGGDFAGFGVICVIGADAGFLSFGLAGGGGGFRPLAPVVTEGGDFAGFGVICVIGADAGFLSRRLAGRRGRGRPAAPIMAESGDFRAFVPLFMANGAFLMLHAGILTGGFRVGHPFPCMSESIQYDILFVQTRIRVGFGEHTAILVSPVGVVPRCGAGRLDGGVIGERNVSFREIEIIFSG